MEVLIVILIIFIGLPILRLFIVEFIIPVYFTKKRNLTVRKQIQDLEKVDNKRKTRKKNINKRKVKSTYEDPYYGLGPMTIKERMFYEGKDDHMYRITLKDEPEGVIQPPCQDNGLLQKIDNNIFGSLYENGNIKSKGKMKDNKRHGMWEYYYPNKELMSVINYKSSNLRSNFKDGFRNGPCKYFYENGKIMSEGSWLNQKLNGKWKYYNINTGRLIFEGNWSSDLMIGVWSIYVSDLKFRNKEIKNGEMIELEKPKRINHDFDNMDIYKKRYQMNNILKGLKWFQTTKIRDKISNIVDQMNKKNKNS